MKLVFETAVFISSTLTMMEPLKYTVTIQQPVGGGLCSKRDWTERLISTVAGMITSTVSEIWMVSFGSDWTRYTAWQKNQASFEWSLKTLRAKQLTLSTTILVLLMNKANTCSVLENTLVRFHLRWLDTLFFKAHLPPSNLSHYWTNWSLLENHYNIYTCIYT